MSRPKSAKIDVRNEEGEKAGSAPDLAVLCNEHLDGWSAVCAADANANVRLSELGCGSVKYPMLMVAGWRKAEVAMSAIRSSVC